VAATGNRLTCFSGAENQPALIIDRNTTADVSVAIDAWPNVNGGDCRWIISYPGQSVALHMVISGLRPQTAYRLQTDGATKSVFHADANGRVTVNYAAEQMKVVAFTLIK
jgi:hypothetical protein